MPDPKTGTLLIEDLLEIETQSIYEYGVESIMQAVERELRIHNDLTNEMISTLAMRTVEKTETYNGQTGGRMMKADELGRVPTQAAKGFQAVAYPLWKLTYAIGWTADFMKKATPADLARQFNNATLAHVTAVQSQIKEAVYPATNYTFNDFLDSKLDLDVKRLVNADGQPITVGPNGEDFDEATHTHYTGIDWGAANAAAKKAALQALIRNVVEHGHGTNVRIIINIAQEADFTAMDGFQAYTDPRMIYRATDTPAKTLDITRLDNRAIGIFGSAEIWVKPWGVPSYVFCYSEGDERKPLKLRERKQAGLHGLRLASEIVNFPLQASYMEAEFGLGVYARTNGAVLYLGNAVYASPSFD